MRLVSRNDAATPGVGGRSDLRAGSVLPVSGPGRPRLEALPLAPRPGVERVKALHAARYPLWKNPDNLTENQRIKLDWIAATDPRLYRAYLLKEGFRLIFTMPHTAASDALDRWISWARRSRIPAFVRLQKLIV